MKKETLFYILPLPLIFLSLFIGPSETIKQADVYYWLMHKFFGISPLDSIDLQIIETVVLEIRLPRIITAFLVGAALTTSGSSLQAMIRNPLVEPYLLGLSSGAAFGAALAMTKLNMPVQISAFVFGLFAVCLTYFLALRKGEISILSMILSGVIVSGIFTACLTIVQFLTDPFRLQGIIYWIMGNLHNASWNGVKSMAIPIVGGSLLLFLIRWRLNVISLGDLEAKTVGYNPTMLKLLILIPSTLIASASVAVAGIIGMVGLVVPHMIRMMIGYDNKKVIPVSFAFGGSFLLLVDNFSRTVSQFEIPIGIFTTLIGGPFFIYLLKRLKHGYGD